MFVKVRDADPILAASIANAVAQQFSQTVLEIELNSSLDLTKLIKLSVVRAAIVSEFPAAPNKRLNYMLGIFIGFMLGFIVSLLLRFLDQSLKSEKDIGDTPLLGVVAFDSNAVSQPLITQLNTYAIRTEAFRLFRTNLLHSLDKTESNCIAISSCYSGEGKSTATLNLAFAIAQSGFSVGIIESDMRRPSLANYLNEHWGNLPVSKFGLSDILCVNGTTELRKKINLATVTLPKVGLDIIFSGTVPSNPAELLGSENFVILIEMIKTKYDYILIDTPPVLSVADASIVSRVTQQIALVLHAGKTSKRNFEAAREGMSSVGVNLTGVLLNKVPKHKAGEHYGYTYSDPQMGYYRYSYSYSPEKIEQKKRFDFSYFSQLRNRLVSKLKSNGTPERSIVSEIETFEDFLKKYKIE
jgi:capsular exopolysaccharide synthesis family protein